MVLYYGVNQVSISHSILFFFEAWIFHCVEDLEFKGHVPTCDVNATIPIIDESICCSKE